MGWAAGAVKGRAVAIKAGANVAAPVRASEDAEGDGEGEDAGAEEEDEERFLRGADLQTDFEADALLRRAREFLDGPEPQYHKAALVLQHLIDTAGNALASEDYLVYHPVRHKAERLLATLPPAGLETYRAEVDGQVQALLGGGLESRDEGALEAVAERFFLSTRGDEAAFLLACLYLDQHEYLRARRLFLRVLRDHPDPSVPPSAILLRLAVACARSGDSAGARAAWQDLQALRVSGPLPDAVEAVRREVFRREPQTPGQTEGKKPDLLPTPQGRYADLPAETLERPRGLWLVGHQHDFDLMPPSSNVRVRVAGHHVQVSAKTSGIIRDHLAARWEQCGWAPTGQMLFRDGAVYFKDHHGVVCMDAETGKLRWRSQREEKKKQATHRTYVSFSSHSLVHNTPVQPYEMLLFGDRLGKALRLRGETLYHIADHHQAHWSRRRVRRVVVVNGKRVVRDSKDVPQGNRLVALDARTGKLRWSLGRTTDEQSPFHDVRFLAVPVLCGGRLVVAVESRSELWLVALEPADGTVAWRTFLCAYTSPMRAPWYGAGLARQGSDVYVSTGQGVVLALDGIDGAIRWASRYERQFIDDQYRHAFRRPGVAGWHENTVLARGHRIVVLPSDAQRILEFDTLSGQLTRSCPSQGLTYVTGVADGSLLAGSAERLARIDLDSGNGLWSRELSGSCRSYGRGFLADDVLYVPSGRTVLRLDAATGKTDTSLRAALPDDELVGTLASDGRSLFVYGLGRVYRLKSGAQEMQAVARRVAALEEQRPSDGPTPPKLLERLGEAYVARARLHEGYGHPEKAAADYRVAVHKLGQHEARQEARDGLFGLLLERAARESKRAAEHIDEALAVARTATQRAEATRALAAEHRRQGRVEDAARALLRLAANGTDKLLELDDGRVTWSVRPDMLAAASTRELLAEHGDRVAAVLEDQGEAVRKAAEAEGDFARLQGVLRAYPGTRASIAAGLAAARMAERKGLIEQAEIILSEMMIAGHRPTEAAGLAGRAALHQRRGWLRQARAEWERLAGEYSDQRVPCDDGGERAADLARRRLAEEAFAGVPLPAAPGMPEPPWRRVWEHKNDKTRYIQFMTYAQMPRPGRMDVSQFLEDHVFLFDRHKSYTLVCKRVRDGKTLYERKLNRGSRPYPLGGHDHLVVWAYQGEVTVFGLASGRELWKRKTASRSSRPFHVRSTSRWGHGAEQLAPGVLVVRPDGRKIQALDLATGGVLWERVFRATAVSWSHTAGRYLVMPVGAQRQTLWVCDALTGEKLGEIDLGGRYMSTPQVIDRGLLCQSYSSGNRKRKVALYELPSGKALWEWDAPQSLRGFWLVKDETACVAGTDGSLHVVNVATGKTRLELPAGQLGGHIYGACLDRTGRYLYLSGYIRTGNEHRASLHVVDLQENRKARTVRQEASRHFRPLAINALARCDRLLPLIVHDPPKKEGKRVRASHLAEVKFLDRETGKTCDELALPVGRKDGKVERLRALYIQDGTLLLIGYNWVQAFRHDDKADKPMPQKPKAKAPDKTDNEPGKKSG
ncbi:MAG: PQQ-binding-like beta-propeller repeat protein [Planctomycetota bacterium]